MNTFFCRTLNESSGKVIIDDPVEIQHCLKSLRKTKGETVRVINGRGLAILGEIARIDKRSIEITPKNIDNSDTEYENRIVIAVGVLNKSSKIKLLVEKLTEIGVLEICFFTADNSAIANKGVSDYGVNLISALKQCRGKILPLVKHCSSLTEVLSSYIYDEIIYCHFKGCSIKKINSEKKYLVIIGPEGGFSKDELNLFMEHRGQVLSLGKRILRAETAAITAAAKILL